MSLKFIENIKTSVMRDYRAGRRSLSSDTAVITDYTEQVNQLNLEVVLRHDVQMGCISAVPLEVFQGNQADIIALEHSRAIELITQQVYGEVLTGLYQLRSILYTEGKLTEPIYKQLTTLIKDLTP